MMAEVVSRDTVLETLNVPGMGDSTVGLVAVLLDKLVTKNVITIAEANAILDDAIAGIRGRSDTPSTSDTITIIEDIRSQLVAKHDNR